MAQQDDSNEEIRSESTGGSSKGDQAQNRKGEQEDIVESSPAAKRAAEGENSDEITGETMKSRQSQM